MGMQCQAARGLVSEVSVRISPRERLKHETKALHKQLDSLPLMHSLTQKDLDVSRYTETLKVMFQWLLVVAPKLSQLDLPNYARPERKIEALSRDLHHLGQPASLHPVSSDVHGLHFAMGIHYVLEGSSMGARLLAPRIEASLGRSDVTQFYRLYGEHTFDYWQRTLSLIDETLDDEQAVVDACEGACWAFISLIERVESAAARHSGSSASE